MDVHVEDSDFRIRDSSILEALNSAQEMKYRAHHDEYPVWFSSCVAPFLRLLKCVGQCVVDDSVVVVGERNGRVHFQRVELSFLVSVSMKCLDKRRQEPISSAASTRARAEHSKAHR